MGHHKDKNINWHTVATSVIGGVLVITIAGFGKMVKTRGDRIRQLEENEKVHYLECKADFKLVMQKLNEHLRDYNQDKEEAK